MKKVKSKNTGPELRVRKSLFAKGLRYRLHDKSLPGSPDLIFPKHKTAIFVHGCFWHFHKDCKKGQIPASNNMFWVEKFKNNSQRDELKEYQLSQLGWKVIVIWECEIKKLLQDENIDKLVSEIKSIRKN